MNILTQDDKIYICNLGEFSIGGATCPLSWVYTTLDFGLEPVLIENFHNHTRKDITKL